MERKFIYCENCGLILSETYIEGSLRHFCNDCGFIRYQDPKLVAVVVIEQDSKILMVKRAIQPSIGFWSIPGGYVDRGEVIEKAGEREVAEETGLVVEVSKLIGVFSESGHPVVVVAYNGVIKGGSLKGGPEVSGLEFFHLNALPPLAFDRDNYILKVWEKWIYRN